MWFDDDDLPGRRFGSRGNRRRGSVLQVQARVAAKHKVNPYQAAALVLIPLLAAGAVFLAYRGVKAAGRRLFCENPRFTITRVDVRGGSETTRRLVREYTQIREGMNLFSFNMGAVRRSILQRAPGFRSMEITRSLPDRVAIEIVERVPLARIGREGVLVVDREGAVFAPAAECPPLPFVIGLGTTGLQPGHVIGGPAVAALEALEVCDDARVSLPVEVVKVDREHLVLVISEGGRTREIRLAWEGMGQNTEASRRDLVDRIQAVKRSLAENRGREFSLFDATLDGRVFAR